MTCMKKHNTYIRPYIHKKKKIFQAKTKHYNLVGPLEKSKQIRNIQPFGKAPNVGFWSIAMLWKISEGTPWQNMNSLVTHLKKHKYWIHQIMNAASCYTESYKSCGKQVVFVMFLYSKCLKTKVGWISDPQKLFGFKTIQISSLNTHFSSKCVWNLDTEKFGFQTFTVPNRSKENSDFKIFLTA